MNNMSKPGDPGVKADGSYGPWKAAQTVATLKSYLLPPYHFVAFIDEAKIPNVPKSQLLKYLTGFSPELQGRELSSMEELLKVFREFQPSGDYLIAIKGVSNVQGAKNPLGFVDTPILEKAIAYHAEQGHPGSV